MNVGRQILNLVFYIQTTSLKRGFSVSPFHLPLPTHYLPYLLTYLTIFLPTYITIYLPTYLLTYLITYLPKYLPT